MVRLRELARALGAMVAEQEGSQGRMARRRGILTTRRPNAVGQWRRRHSAMAKHLTVAAVEGHLAVGRTSVYKMLAGGVFAETPSRLLNDNPRWLQLMADEWVEAHGWEGQRPRPWRVPATEEAEWWRN